MAKREAADSKKMLYKEMDQLMSDHKQQIKELVEQIQFLHIELDTSRKSCSDVTKVC